MFVDEAKVRIADERPVDPRFGIVEKMPVVAASKVQANADAGRFSRVHSVAI